MIEEVTESTSSGTYRQSVARKTPDIKPKDNPVKEPETKPEPAEPEVKPEPVEPETKPEPVEPETKPEPEPGNDPELSAEEPNHNAPEDAPAGENEK